MPTEEGTLVIADISGYTGFVFDDPIAIEHSSGILAELIETVTNSFENHLSVELLEGDAVFAAGAKSAEVLPCLDASFTAFHRRLRDMRAVTHCPCKACVNLGVLGLKFVVHWGSYTRQQVGGRDQLFGASVITVHRLLKNTVPIREYVLATNPVVDAWRADGPFLPAPQEYPDVGRLEAAYLDLGPLRTRAWTHERTVVRPEEARLHLTHTFTAPPASVWDLLVDPEARKRWLGAEKVELKGGARGTLLGAQYHCHHGAGAPTIFHIISFEKPRQFTQFCAFSGFGDVYATYELRDEPAGRTAMDVFYFWDLAPETEAALIPILEQYHVQSSQNLDAMLAEAAAI